MRGVGLALIAMPEPLTTVPGVALVLASNIRSPEKLYPRRWAVREPISCNALPLLRPSYHRPSELNNGCARAPRLNRAVCRSYNPNRAEEKALVRYPLIRRSALGSRGYGI